MNLRPLGPPAEHATKLRHTPYLVIIAIMYKWYAGQRKEEGKRVAGSRKIPKVLMKMGNAIGGKGDYAI